MKPEPWRLAERRGPGRGWPRSSPRPQRLAGPRRSHRRSAGTGHATGDPRRVRDRTRTAAVAAVGDIRAFTRTETTAGLTRSTTSAKDGAAGIGLSSDNISARAGVGARETAFDGATGTEAERAAAPSQAVRRFVRDERVMFFLASERAFALTPGDEDRRLTIALAMQNIVRLSAGAIAARNGDAGHARALLRHRRGRPDPGRRRGAHRGNGRPAASKGTCGRHEGRVSDPGSSAGLIVRTT